MLLPTPPSTLPTLHTHVHTGILKQKQKLFNWIYSHKHNHANELLNINISTYIKPLHIHADKQIFACTYSFSLSHKHTQYHSLLFSNTQKSEIGETHTRSKGDFLFLCFLRCLYLCTRESACDALLKVRLWWSLNAMPFFSTALISDMAEVQVSPNGLWWVKSVYLKYITNYLVDMDKFSPWQK